MRSVWPYPRGSKRITVSISHLHPAWCWPMVLGVSHVGYDYKTMRAAFRELFYKLYIKRKSLSLFYCSILFWPEPELMGKCVCDRKNSNPVPKVPGSWSIHVLAHSIKYYWRYCWERVWQVWFRSQSCKPYDGEIILGKPGWSGEPSPGLSLARRFEGWEGLDGREIFYCWLWRWMDRGATWQKVQVTAKDN